MGYSGTPDEIRVVIAAEVDRAIADFQRAAQSVRAGSRTMGADLDGVGAISNKVANKIQNTSTAIGFAIASMASSGSADLTTLLRSFTALSFAINPVAGGIALALSSIADAMKSSADRTRDESKRLTDSLLADARRLSEYSLAALEVRLSALNRERQAIAESIRLQGQNTPQHPANRTDLSPQQRNFMLGMTSSADRESWTFPEVPQATLDRFTALEGLIRETARALEAAKQEQTELSAKLSERDAQIAIEQFNDEYSEMESQMAKAFQRAREWEEQDKQLWRERRQEIERAKQATWDLLAIQMQAFDIAWAAEQRANDEQKRLQDQIAAGWEQTFNAIPNAAERAFRDVIQSGESMKAFWRFLVQEMAAGMIEAAWRSVAAWAAAELAKRNITRRGVLERVALESWAALQSIAIATWEALKWVGLQAIKAAAATWAVVSEIPKVGPFLAPLMAAAALAGVLALGSSIASAAGGYDIPGGVNPVTQLHEREMVLPANLADRIRGMTDGGGGDTYHVYAMDSEDVERFLRKNSRAVARAAQRGARNGAVDRGIGRSGGRRV